jgi:hypothetical protein
MSEPTDRPIPDVSTEDQLKCLDRELALRRNVYARRVQEGKMSREDAAREYDTMRAVRRTVELAAAAASPVCRTRSCRRGRPRTSSGPTSGPTPERARLSAPRPRRAFSGVRCGARRARRPAGATVAWVRAGYAGAPERTGAEPNGAE